MTEANLSEAPIDGALAARKPQPHRDARLQVPLWRLTGSYELLTPLHIGTGRDAPIQIEARIGEPVEQAVGASADTDERFVATVVRDHAGRPCIPASSFKGALNELARRAQVDLATRARLFGSEDPDAPKGNTERRTTRAAAVEFTYLYAVPASLPGNSSLPDFGVEGHPHVAHLAHVSRNRDTGAAQEQRLFLQQVLPPTVRFNFVCTARGVSRPDIETLLGLLALAGEAGSPFRLGAGQAADQGRVAWTAGEARQITSAAHIWAALNAPAAHNDALEPGTLWEQPRLATRPTGLKAQQLGVPATTWLQLSDLALKFHSPFLVYQRRKKTPGSGEPDGGPRRNHAGEAALPSHSLHGALRAQAERILRTVGRPTQAGYEVPGVQGLQQLAERLNGGQLDLASLLFGAPGWRSLVRCSDFTAPARAATLTHHMLAIDRLTGGGKDSAKFAIEVLDCPTLRGSIGLDMSRLRRVDGLSPGAAARAVGLLGHVLRDLDEGDVPLGYGAAKGYGQMRSQCASQLEHSLTGARWHRGPDQLAVPTLSEALRAFAEALPPAAPAHPALADALVAARGRNGAKAALQDPKKALSPAGNGPTAAASEADRFHNPYVFIPWPRPRPDDPQLPWADRDDLKLGEAGHHSHARYANDALHGVLSCSLLTTTPIFIGAGDVPGTTDPKQKENFRLRGAAGSEIVLPATSLRGLVSSLHESLSASRLRAATDRHDSVRWVAAMQELDRNAGSPSAVGRLIRLEGKPGLWLQMLALPVLQVVQGEKRVFIGRAFSRLLRAGDTAPFKSLVGDAAQDFSAYVPLPGKARPVAYLQDRLQLRVQQDRGTDQLFIELDELDAPALHVQRSFLLGHRRQPGEMPTNRPAHNAVTRGVLRVMRAPGRDLPDTRYHELFLPFSEEQEAVRPAAQQFITESVALGRQATDHVLIERFCILPVPDHVITRFCEVADAMTATQDNIADLGELQYRPYHPLGQERQNSDPGPLYGGLDPKNRRRALRPKHNDLVFFCPAADGNSIDEISYSSLWRRALDRSTAEFLAQTPGTPSGVQLLPDGDQPAPRLSPSELLFGTVDVRSKKSVSSDRLPATAEQTTAQPVADPVLGWSGKVWFSAARSATPVRLAPEVTLKILASPKPPSPSMYFQAIGTRNAAPPTKAELWYRPADHQLRGRKAYLHALRDDSGKVRPLNSQGEPDPAGRAPWASAHSDSQTVQQKVRITPIKAGERFDFAVRFNNLSLPELESLCASLRPLPDFEHKIGMGKPIGLGSVKIELLGLHLSDRQCRYRQVSFSDTASMRPALDPVELSAQHMARLQQSDPAVHQAVSLIGDHQQIKYPVHYPQQSGLDIEKDTYKWFVNNDKTGKEWPSQTRQALEQISAQSTELKGLTRRARTTDPSQQRAGFNTPRPPRRR